MAASAVAKAAFQPRLAFDPSASLPRSYFLGHHHAALERMRRVLSNVGLIIECRDFRVPLTSWNPLLEQGLAASPAERARIVVYTKRDLGPPTADPRGAEVVRRLQAFHAAQRPAASAVLFLGEDGGGGGNAHQQHNRGDRKLLEAVKRVAEAQDSMTGLRALVVGMPNAGKSTLLNRLRARGMGLPKAARTGAQPGVTRKLGTPVRVVPASERIEEGVFIMDTPGVFVPYVEDAESMLKLALVGCVKDGLVPHVALADYLLFQLNLPRPGEPAGPGVYAEYSGPTNDVHEFLAGVARRTGKLAKGGVPSLEGAADWVVKMWRKGELGRFILDDVGDESIQAAVAASAEPPLSMNQARKRAKEARKERAALRYAAAQGQGSGETPS